MIDDLIGIILFLLITGGNYLYISIINLVALSINSTGIFPFSDIVWLILMIIDYCKFNIWIVHNMKKFYMGSNQLKCNFKMFRVKYNHAGQI